MKGRQRDGLTPLSVSLSVSSVGFPGGASGKEPDFQCKGHKRFQLDPWVRKIRWRGAWQPTPVFLLGEPPWTEEPGGVATVHGVARSRIRQKQLSSRSSSRVCQAWTWSVTMCCPSPPPQTHADQDLGFLFVVLVAQLSLALCSPTDCSAPGSSVHGISPAKHWSGSPFPSPGDLANQGSNLHLLPWQVDSLPPSHRRSPRPGFVEG